MTVRYDCDAPDCTNQVEAGSYRIGLDEYVPDVDDDEPAETRGVSGLHFCSLACLIEWAFARRIDDQG